MDRVRCVRRLHSFALPAPVVRQVLTTLCGDPETTGPLLAGLDERIDRLAASRSHLVGLIEDVRVRTRG